MLSAAVVIGPLRVKIFMVYLNEGVLKCLSSERTCGLFLKVDFLFSIYSLSISSQSFFLLFIFFLSRCAFSAKLSQL